MIEPLEDRRLLSAAVAVMPVTTVPAAHVAAPPTVAHVARLQPFDDDGDDSSDSGGTSGSDDGGEGSGDSGSTGVDDGGEGAGTTDIGGSADGGSSSDSGGEGAGDAGSGGTVPSPVDNAPPNNSGGGGLDAGGTTDDGGDQSVVLYPTGDPYDDSLYDDGGGTIVVIPPTPRAADFGGALRVHLPPNPVAGDAGVATVDVFNTGGRASGTFELAVGVTPDGSAASAIRVADQQVPVHLGHDRVAAYRVPFTLPTTLTPGTYRFLALIDAGNAFAETDEADNVAVGPSFTVAAATSDVSVTSANAAHAARAGRPAAVAVHLRSVGSMAASGTTTITVTATPVDGSTAPVRVASVARPVRLARDQAMTIRLRVPLPALPVGRYQLTVTVTPVSPTDTNAADKSAVTKATLIS